MAASQWRVLANSLPKSGTHLLAQAVTLCGFPEHFAGAPLDDPTRLTPLFLNYREARDALASAPPPAGADGTACVAVGALLSYPVPLPALRRWLAALAPGRHIIGHVPWHPELPALLVELDCRHVFIIRDPRAVLVSLLAFILDSRQMPRRHLLEADLRERTPEQRLDFIENGGYAPQAGVTVAGFAAMYRAMEPWRSAPGCLILRYEDLVGTAGGGSAAAQWAAIARLATHLEVPPVQRIAERAAEVYNPNSRTFRTGTISGWQHGLDEATQARVAAICAPLGHVWGY